VNEAAQRRDIVTTVLRGAQQVAEARRNFVSTQALAAYNEENAAFRREMDNYDTITAAQADEIASQYGVDIDTTDKQFLRKDQWYPQVLERQLSESRQRNLQGIEYGPDRQQLDNKLRSEELAVLEREGQVAAEQARRANQNEQRAAVNTALQNGQWDTAEALLRASGLYDGQPEALELEIQKIRNNRDAEEFQVVGNQIVNTGSDAELEGLLSDLTDPEARAAFNVDEKTKQVMTNRVRGEIDRRQGVVRGDANEIAKDSYQNYVSAVESGREVSPAQLADVKVDVAGTPYAEALDLRLDTEVYALKPVDERAAELQALEGSDTLDNQARYASYVAANAKIAQGVQDEGYAFGVKQGLIEFIPLNLADPSTWEARQEQAQFMSRHYGIPVSPMAQGEADAIAASIPAMSVADQIALTSTFESTPEVWEQLSKGGATVFALVGATGDPNLSNIVLQGQKRLENKLSVPPTQKDTMTAAYDYLGDVYDTKNMQAVVDAANAYYAQVSPTGAEGDFDLGVYEEALAAVAPVGQVNGFNTSIPRGTDAGIMQDYVDTFSAEQVRLAGGVPGYTDGRAAEIIQESRWRAVDNNTYEIIYNNNRLMTVNPETGELVPLRLEYTDQQALGQEATEFSQSRQKRQWRPSNIGANRGMSM